jgi:hypothetical protein
MVFILFVLIGMYSYGGDKEKYGFYVPSSNEEWCGTWVSKDTSRPTGEPQKVINNCWGYYEVFTRLSDTTPHSKGCSTLVDKWTDSKGNIWYKEYDREPWTSKGLFVINKISKNGNVLEYVWSQDGFPTENDVNSKNSAMHYNILYRQ